MTYTWCRRPGRDRSGQRPGGCRKEWRQTWTARRQQHNQQPATSATRRRTSDDDQSCNAKIDDWLFWTSCRQYFSRCNTKNEILKMILRMIIYIKKFFNCSYYPKISARALTCTLSTLLQKRKRFYFHLFGNRINIHDFVSIDQSKYYLHVR